MRPTITPQEASFIVKVLKAEMERLRELSKREQIIKGELTILRYDAMKWKDTYILGITLPKKKEELRQIQQQLSKLSVSTFILNGLIAKYEALATGKLSKGGRPRSVVTLSLAMLFNGEANNAYT